MARRLQLHEKLCEILGSRNVYFQPPESVKIKYDCIVYRVSNRNDIKADNKRYRNLICYEAIFIHRDPDSEISEDIMQSFDYVMHNNTFTTDNLHHDVFSIYY